MGKRIEYGAPRRLNAVSITLLLLFLAGGYWIWRFFPAYFDGWGVDHILRETAAQVYRANRLREPERTETLTGLVDKAKLDMRKRLGITDPDLSVGLEIDDTRAALSADYSVIITHPFTTRTTRLNFHKVAEATMKSVDWDK